jgi:hypothetical protein
VEVLREGWDRLYEGEPDSQQNPQPPQNDDDDETPEEKQNNQVDTIIIFPYGVPLQDSDVTRINDFTTDLKGG